LEKALSFGNQLCTSFVLLRRRPRALIVPERAEALAEREPATPCSRVGRRVAFANAACSSQFAWKPRRAGHATQSDDRARGRNHKRRTMTARDRKSAFAVRPGGPEVRGRNPEYPAVESVAKAKRFTERLPIDVVPELRGRIKVAAFQRGLMVAKTPRGPFAREFPQRQGDGADGRSHRG
jgi:hypothetical protein